MIAKETIERIFETARIEEVVGDFVTLKKRGVNLIGLCPFHNEKTPSFNVNSVRNIFKCFGCGKGGSAVNFIMEHEHYSYPDALRYLAAKYNIEIAEDIPTPEEAVLRDEKESMMVLNSFAQKNFSENLFDTEEGKAIGLTYFKERHFSEATIRKFQLGYSLNGWDAFTKHAMANTYQAEFLVKTGLSIKREQNSDSDTGKDVASYFDRFKGRVMFPIHNLSGRVIGFGGRILKKDDKAAKYINSPESEVYHKSQVLYGMYFAKKSILQNDVCFLAEGYTDVISLHQAGIENAVSSSGTSLTMEQIRLISRYTKNITILYDGDEAGIKASLRGMELILEEGLNVRIVLFPDGDDPDSFARKHSEREIVNFIANNAKDFVLFKTGLLMKEVSNDPIRKAQLIREVVETIARIPDAISRSTYVKHCSSLMEIEERVLINELNNLRRLHLKKNIEYTDLDELNIDTGKTQPFVDAFDTDSQERELIRLMLNYGNDELEFYEGSETDEQGNKKLALHKSSVLNYIHDEMTRDEITFSNELHKKLYREIISHATEKKEIISNYFFAHQDPQICSFAVEMLTKRHFLSENWHAKHDVFVPDEKLKLQDGIERAVYRYKNKKVEFMRQENQKRIHEAQALGEDYDDLMRMQISLDTIKQEISKVLGIVILK